VRRSVHFTVYAAAADGVTSVLRARGRSNLVSPSKKFGEGKDTLFLCAPSPIFWGWEGRTGLESKVQCLDKLATKTGKVCCDRLLL